MLKTLRIVSFFTIITAAVVIVAVSVFALRANPEIQAFLAREGVIDQFRKKAEKVSQKEDVVSPFEAAAKAFALRIDPPPPPPPPKPKDPPKPKQEEKPPEVVRPPMEIKRPQLSAKFSLVATARYPNQPSKSMALLKSLQNEYTWYRQGEQVGHLDLEEIRDGSVVLYQGGKFNTEIFMPTPPEGKSLLKGDQTKSVSQGPSTVSVTTSPEHSGEGMVVTTTPSSTLKPDESGQRTIPSRLSGRDRIRPVMPKRSASSTSRPVRSAPQQTPEEQKASIQDSISSIEEIMNRPSVEGQSEEVSKAEQESWRQLLDILKFEHDRLEKVTEDGGDPPEGSGPPKRSGSSEDKPGPEDEKSGKIQ